MKEESAETTRVIPSLKPIWRSVGFWLGMVTSIFLLWAAIDSVYRTTSVVKRSALTLDILGMKHSSLHWTRVQIPPSLAGSSVLPTVGWHVEREMNIDIDPDAPGLVGAWRWRETRYAGDFRFTEQFSIPILAILIVWLVLCRMVTRVWRSRREKKA